MKTNLLGRLATLVVALFVTSSVSTSWGQGTVRFESFIVILDYPTPSLTVSTVTYGIETGNPQGCVRVANGATIPISQLFNYGTSGSILRYGFALVSSSKFSLNQVQYTQENPVFGSSSGTFTRYTNLGYGIDAGADNVLGTADDVKYTGNQGSALVNAVYMLGVGTTFDVGNTPINEAINFWAPFNRETFSYGLGSSTISGQVNFSSSVPEPASSTLVLLGLISLHTLKKKK